MSRLVEELAEADHGGSLEAARALFPAAPAPLVDLSSGINPHAYTLPALPAASMTRLPEPPRIAALEAAAARAYGAPAGANVVAVPGTQAVLSLVAGLRPPGEARILAPTYSGHAPAARAAGHAVSEVAAIGDLAGAVLAIIVNPNNPDGRLTGTGALADLAAAIRAGGGSLVVDEAFMDVAPAGSTLAGAVEAGGIVVLRSFGKFYGLAGLRLGFAIADAATADRLRSRLGPWAVSGPALEYGLAAFANDEWREAMRRRLAEEAARLDRAFARYGVTVVGGTSLFRYLRDERAPALFEHLGAAGLFLRRFPERPHHLRCGLPPDDAAFRRLEAALASWQPRAH